MIALALAAFLAAPADVQVSLPSQPAPLQGSLLTPEGETHAAALLISGSGPTDRDGNSPLGVSADYLKQLAQGLAADGIATIRFDKRGVAASAAAGVDEADLRFDMYVEDVRAWAVEVVRLTGQPCAWLIGHSEGSLIALAAARSGDTTICGVVSLSGAGRPAGVVLREQLTSLPEPLKAQAYAALDELEAGRNVAEPPPVLAALFRPSVQPYLISWLPLDPAALAAAYTGPLFIGQGTTDLQTTVQDAQALAAARPDARLALWDGVNHVLKSAPAERTANLATYADPALPLAPGVIEDVAAFILQAR